MKDEKMKGRKDEGVVEVVLISRIIHSRGLAAQ